MRKSMALAIGISLPLYALGAEQIGTITTIQGDVRIFTHPSHNAAGPSPRALFEGEYFTVKSARPGDRVEKTNIVRTSPSAQARIVFDNGDQYNVGPGTAYRVNWDKDTSDGKSEVNLMYGSLRGIVKKGGPRSRLNVRTRSATMGVRGTDFFIADEGGTGKTEIAILRGEVEVKSVATKAEPFAIKSGYSALVQNTPTPADPSKPLVTRTTQQDLAYIQEVSMISKAALKETVNDEENPQRERLAALEKKAIDTTIQDIKEHDPAMFAKLNAAGVGSVEEINALTIKSVLDTAPRGVTRTKPGKKDLENSGQGVYEKYYKVD